MTTEPTYHAVAIVGGATAGAEMAGRLADSGVVAVVFEQNQRPYGKIEDGLPRWHVKLRRKEYQTIDAKLDRPGVHYVPSTKIGRDVSLEELVDDWGFSVVVLAQGAWRDRPLPVDGAERYRNRGLVYQNDLIYWFNHHHERAYEGPRYEIADGAIVVGGGLASIDVMKVLQIELVQRVLSGQGIDEEMQRLETDGIPAVLEEHGLTWERLGLTGPTLFYRRRIEDMPLAEMPADADDDRRRKVEATRRRILEKAASKYCFAVRPQHVPIALIVERDWVVGLRFQRTRVEEGRAVPIEGEDEDVYAPLVVSSIGSVPEPMPGIEQEGLLYRYEDSALGRLGGYDSVFGTGNVVTGKGNILTSRRHSKAVAAHVLHDQLGVEDGPHDEPTLADDVRSRPGLDAAALERLLERVRARQAAVGYTGSYREWIAAVTPADLA